MPDRYTTWRIGRHLACRVLDQPRNSQCNPRERRHPEGTPAVHVSPIVIFTDACVLWRKKAHCELVVGEALDVGPAGLHTLMNDMQAMSHHGEHDHGGPGLEAVHGLLRELVDC